MWVRVAPGGDSPARAQVGGPHEAPRGPGGPFSGSLFTYRWRGAGAQRATLGPRRDFASEKRPRWEQLGSGEGWPRPRRRLAVTGRGSWYPCRSLRSGGGAPNAMISRATPVPSPQMANLERQHCTISAWLRFSACEPGQPGSCSGNRGNALAWARVPGAPAGGGRWGEVASPAGADAAGRWWRAGRWRKRGGSHLPVGGRRAHRAEPLPAPKKNRRPCPRGGRTARAPEPWGGLQRA